MKPLSNFDIDRIMKKAKINNYVGTCSKDMLPKKVHRNASAVINLQDYFVGPGTHWTCVYNDSKSENIEYFDSFGLVPPNEIINYMKTSNKNIVYSDSYLQNINSIMCGYYCLYYIMERYNRRKPDEIISDFHDNPTVFNEAFIQYFANFI